MKLMFASDIHGSAYYCEKMLDAYDRENAERLILLGDLLYHGPRNDLPRGYDPKQVIGMLNKRKNDIYAVRGNCDAEVDQMVLEFPIMADSCLIMDGSYTIYGSHGHVYDKDHLPPLKEGDIFIQGHTHIAAAEKRAGIYLLNPGSVAIPKEKNIPSYGIINNGIFQVKGFHGELMIVLRLNITD